MKKTTNIFIFVLFGVTAWLILYCAYLAFYPVKYFESSTPYRIINENKTVKVGEDLIYEVDYCKYQNYIPVRVQRSLIDGFSYDLPVNTTSNFPVGCHTVRVIIPLYLPANIPVDHKYHMNITIDYKLNPLRSETRSFQTEDFTLIK